MPLPSADRIGVRLGDPDAAAIVQRHRNRLLHVGLAGHQSHFETLGHQHLFGGFLGREAGEGILVGLGRGRRVGKHRPLGVQLEVVEVQMSPAAAAGVDQADEKILAHVRPQIGHHRLERFGVVSGAFEDDLVIVAADQLDARVVLRAAGDAEADEGLREFERRAGESALRTVAVRDFESADPELPGVFAGHAASASRDRVTLDRLAGKGFAGGDPVVERPFFEIEIERMPPRPFGSSPTGPADGAGFGSGFFGSAAPADEIASEQ